MACLVQSFIKRWIIFFCYSLQNRLLFSEPSFSPRTLWKKFLKFAFHLPGHCFHLILLNFILKGWMLILWNECVVTGSWEGMGYCVWVVVTATCNQHHNTRSQGACVFTELRSVLKHLSFCYLPSTCRLILELSIQKLLLREIVPSPFNLVILL